MKRYIILFFAALLLVGCASVRQSEFLDHGAVYRSWSHLKFSVISYKHPEMNHVDLSGQEKWWGIPVVYQPQPEGKIFH